MGWVSVTSSTAAKPQVPHLKSFIPDCDGARQVLVLRMSTKQDIRPA